MRDQRHHARVQPNIRVAVALGTRKRWIDHVRYQQIIENHDGFPVDGTHLSLEEADLRYQSHPKVTLTELQQYFKQELSEIICVVEGIDPLMAGSFQALQSYRYEDIVFRRDASFAPCLRMGDHEGHVDLDRFHVIERNPFRNSRIKSHSLRSHDSVFFSSSG